jgi:hypothetical protein
VNGTKTLVSNRLMWLKHDLSVKSSSRWADSGIGLLGTVRAEHVRGGSQAANKYEAGLCRADIEAHGNVGVERVRRIASGPVMRLRSVGEPGRVFNSQLALGLYKGLFKMIQFIRSQLTVAGLLHVFDRPEAM